MTRTRPAFALIAVALAASLASSDALAAAPKDAQAEKAMKAAMDSDYLETKFDAAEKKLQAAITACGDAGCTPTVKARVYVALATVLAGGKKQLADAREAFVEALKLDPAIKPDPDLLSEEISFAYENARKELKLDAPAAASGQSGPSSGGLKHTPVKEQRVRTPVPLYVEVDPTMVEMVSRVSVSFLSPGADDWESLLMKKVAEGGFGINLPCDDVANEGTLKYHITVTAQGGAILAAVGSRTQPLTTSIKKSIEGEPPHFPGFAPPDTCSATEESKQCLDDGQCSEQLACVGGVCVPRSARPPEPPPKGYQNWISLTFQPDVSFFSGEGVCLLANQTADNFTCIREDGTRYTGTPTPDVANNVNAGFSLSTVRVALSYERVFLHNFTGGLRLGFGLFGGQQNVSFFPLHIEARGAYWLGKRPFESKGVRPFVMVSAGATQINSPVEVQVLEDGVACGADPGNINDPCTKSSNRESTVEKRLQFLDAYKQAGYGFASLGGGVALPVMDRVSFIVGLRVGMTFPVLTMVVSPEAGASVGF